MKTVWIINHYAQVPTGPGGVRHYLLAKGLLPYGWRACVVSASVEHNTGVQRLRPGQSFRLDDVNGVSFLWLRVPSSKGNGFSRIYNMFSFSISLLVVRLRTKLPSPTVIIGSSVHPFACFSAQRLARRFQIPFIFEVRDLWPQTLIDFGVIKEKGLAANLLRLLEGFLYQQASAIISPLPFAHRYISRFGIKSSSVHWIPNGVDLELWPLTPPPEMSDHLCLMYFGSFGNANAIDILLLALSELKYMSNAPNVSVRLIGDGPLKDSLMQLAEDLNLRNVSFEPARPKSEIPLVASNADFFWLNLIDSPLYQYGISLNKLYDYMAAARPIVFGSSAINNPIDCASAGVTVPPDNPSLLAEAIKQIALVSTDERIRMGLAGRNYVSRLHSSDKLARSLASLLDDVDYS